MSVSLSDDGNTVAIGAPRNNGNGTKAGHVCVYKYDSGVGEWSQVGQDIDGEDTSNYSGWSVSLSNDGNKVAIGAKWNDGNGDRSGHVRVYKYDDDHSSFGGKWIQVGQDIDGEHVCDQSGYSVSLSGDGNIVAIGSSSNDDNGDNAGHVRLFKYDNAAGKWSQVGQDVDGENAGDSSGHSVSLSDDGNTVAIGAKGNDDNGYYAGQVRVYKYDSASGKWQQIGQDMDGENAYDFSGINVSLSGDGNTVAIGAVGNEGNGTDAGHVRIYYYAH